METLPTRQQEVLKATVLHYVDTIEPVSSKTLVKRFRLQTSAATVRSAMGVLEQKGLLKQPHTSAGRIPSAQGYRHYVDQLLPPPGAAVQRLEKELTNLSLQWAALDDLLWQLTKRLTDFTGLMSLITKPTKQEPTLQEIKLVPSGDRLLVILVENAHQVRKLDLRLPNEALKEISSIEQWFSTQINQSKNRILNWSNLPPQLRLSGSILKEAIESNRLSSSKTDDLTMFHGLSRLISQPEFSHSQSFQPLLELMDTQPSAVIPINNQARNRVWIGAEHPDNALAECSVVQASYQNSSKGIGQVALIGPMRMTYSTAMAAVKSVAKHLERVLS